MNIAAEKLLSQTWMRSTSKLIDILAFRGHISQSNLAEIIHDSKIAFEIEFLNDPRYSDLFLNKAAFLKKVSDEGGLASLLSKRTIASYNTFLDSSSIVLAHATLDGAILDYLNVAAMVAPLEKLEELVSRKQITIDDLKGSNIETIIRNKVREHLSKLEWESMLIKVDRIFFLCAPLPNDVPLNNYEFDLDKIKAFDKLRHDIIHRESTNQRIERAYDTIDYIQRTNNYFLALLTARFGLKLHADYMRSADDQCDESTP